MDYGIEDDLIYAKFTETSYCMTNPPEALKTPTEFTITFDFKLTSYKNNPPPLNILQIQNPSTGS